LPSFNDLYWTGWGNPNLTAEDALNSEISVKFDNKEPKNELKFRLTAFNNHIRNMIVWLPRGSIWTPENMDRVRTYGLEIETSYHSKIGKIKYGFQTQYSWTKSMSGGFQMMYVPEHKGVFNLEGSIKGYFLNYNHMLTSYRYANKENTIYVDGFQVANLGIGKTLLYSNYSFRLATTIKNLYNASYQVVRLYPSPPRSFEISVSISYKHSKA
jgi:iron complex outermembrane receptor protein